MGELVCESESHFLDHCDTNAKQRASLLVKLKQHITSFGIEPEQFHNDIGSIISFDWLGTVGRHDDESAEHECTEIIRRTAHFIGDCFNRRVKFLDSLAKFKRDGIIKTT